MHEFEGRRLSTEYVPSTDIGGVQTNTSSSHLSPELVLYEESLGLAVFTVPDASQTPSVIRRR